MLNTYGMRSINRETFNQRYHGEIEFPLALRNKVVTALRVNNAILNVLGYIPVTSLVSGCVRMTVGLAITGVTLAIGNRNAKEGAIIGRFYDEAISTGIAQIARGALEALVPFGWAANAVLDVVVTPFNLGKEIEGSLGCDVCRMGMGSHIRPHGDVYYPLPLGFLYLV